MSMSGRLHGPAALPTTPEAAPTVSREREIACPAARIVSRINYTGPVLNVIQAHTSCVMKVGIIKYYNVNTFKGWIRSVGPIM
jgi:hypothetical protein